MKSKESLKSKKARQLEIISILAKEYPDVTIQLHFENPFELLIATILSAQCTDARVNIVTKSLFKKYKSPQDYLDARQDELEKDIFSTGFYRAKAKNIRGCCNLLIEKFDNKVPQSMEELTSLPGVGRKTANVVLSHCFNIPGVVVDTHVTRLSNRMGFVETEDAVKIEMELMKIIPKELWVIFTHYYINLGRELCTRKPKCDRCKVNHLCRSAFKA